MSVNERRHIPIRLLDSGYLHARRAICEWAQWPRGKPLREEHFFPESSAQFRADLRLQLELATGPLP